MSTTTLSTQEFEQAPCVAEKAAESGPVFITQSGLPTLVLLNADEYFHLLHQGKNLVELLADPDSADIELEICPREIEELRHLDLD